jgi:AbrB family looped-hinge helix DNA binding protein
MRVSEKGQITIPKNLRELAGIKPNGNVSIYLEGGRLVIETADRSVTEANKARLERFMEALRKLEGTGDPSISADDVLRATRDR